MRKAQERSRIDKIEQFARLCEPCAEDLILDVGITGVEHNPYDNMLEKLYARKLDIIGLGISEDLTRISEKYDITCIKYAGRVFPFADNSVDIVYSNAVLEHVGNFSQQCFFVSEMVRVAKRSIFLTTPNRWFPVELHTKLPFVHYLPKTYAGKFYQLAGKSWAGGNYMYLLSQNQLKEILRTIIPTANVSYRIIPNKILSMPVTYSLFLQKNNRP